MATVWTSAAHKVPDCPRPDPLKRLVTKRDDNGNLGQEFVKCLSKPMARRDGKVRSQFLARSFAVFCSDFSIFCFFSSNLGFRVHDVLFRSLRNVTISSGLMNMLIGFSLRATMIRAWPQPGSSIWAGCRRLLWRIRGARAEGRAESYQWRCMCAMLNCMRSPNWPRN